MKVKSHGQTFCTIEKVYHKAVTHDATSFMGVVAEKF